MASKQVTVVVVGDSRSAQKALRDLGGVAGGAESKLKTLGTKLSSVGSKMSSAGTKLTHAVTFPILAAGAGMVKLASDASETENKVRVTFGKMGQDIIGWSESSIDRMGLAKQTAQDMATQFGLLFQAAKLPGAEVTSLSEDFTQLAADMASFFNVPATDALDALRSGLTGEAEPLRKFGVFLSEAAVQTEAVRLGLVKEGEALTEQQKITARAAIIQDSLTKASGDYTRTSEGVANKTRATVERFKEMGAELGQKLIPIAERLLTWADKAITWFDKLSPKQQDQIIKWGAIAAAAGPVLKILGEFVQVAGGTLRALSSIGGALGGVAGKFKAARAAGLGWRASLTGSIGTLGAYGLAIGAVATAILKLNQYFQQDDREGKKWTNTILSGKESLEEYRAAVLAVTGDRSWTDKFNGDQTTLDALQHTIDNTRRAWREMAIDQGSSADGAVVFTTVMESAEAITRKQQKAIAGAIAAHTKWVGPIDDATAASVKNWLAIGEVDKAVNELTEDIPAHTRGLQNMQTREERLAEATADHNQHLRAEAGYIRAVKNVISPALGALRNLLSYEEQLNDATRLHNEQLRIEANYIAGLGTGAGGGGRSGGGGGGASSGGGGRPPGTQTDSPIRITVKNTLEPRKFARALDQVIAGH